MNEIIFDTRTSLQKVGSICGDIINDYVPIKSEEMFNYFIEFMPRFKITNIQLIKGSRISFLKGCTNIKHIYVKFKVDNIDVLSKNPVQTISMNKFDGNLEPLRESKLNLIHMNSFTGDLSPLKGLPIVEIVMNKFDGNLHPLYGAPIRKICMNSFTGELEPLKMSPIKHISMDRFNGILVLFLKVILNVKLHIYICGIFIYLKIETR